MIVLCALVAGAFAGDKFGNYYGYDGLGNGVYGYGYPLEKGYYGKAAYPYDGDYKAPAKYGKFDKYDKFDKYPSKYDDKFDYPVDKKVVGYPAYVKKDAYPYDNKFDNKFDGPFDGYYGKGYAPVYGKKEGPFYGPFNGVYAPGFVAPVEGYGPYEGYVPAEGYPVKGYPVAGYGYPDAYPVKGFPVKGYPVHGYPTKGYPTKGFPVKGYPVKGYPEAYPVKGFPVKGYPVKGYPSVKKVAVPVKDDFYGKGPFNAYAPVVSAKKDVVAVPAVVAPVVGPFNAPFAKKAVVAGPAVVKGVKGPFNGFKGFKSFA